uniref:Histone deacetylase 14 n=1 Tax=Tanacetum cinerariifolium TaxID=118510 RepID=A0A6L2N8Z2_TANCI|nr:hypothetical protein [Tanacetum cinerariifolium]
MLTYEAKTGAYYFELDETRFVLDANLLREALEITPIDQAHQFMSHSLGDAIMNFMNELGYTEVIHFVLRMASIQTFLTDKANLRSPTKKKRKDKPHVIPYCQFTKLIICHLERIHNIHQRSASSFHLAEEDFRLGNLKFVSKGEVDEVFGMPIPQELISNNIKNAPYYNAYMEMVTKHDQQVTAKNKGKKKTASSKQPKSKPAIEKSSKPAPAPKPKATKERLSKLVDEPDEEPAHSEPEPKLEHQGEGDEDDMERAIQMSLESFQAQRKGKAIVTKEQAAHSLLALHMPKKKIITDQFIFQRRTLAIDVSSTGPSTQAQDDTSANIICDSPSPANAETGVASEKTNSGDELDQGQAGSDPSRTLESRPPPEQVVMDEDQDGPDPEESRGALAGPDPEPTHDEFMADLYPKVQESLKFLADEHVILEDPISSTETLSSMKNLEDAYAIGDQFINDKPTEDEPEKPNVEAEVVSMVIVPIYQASSSVPLLSTPVPVIDLSHPKPASSIIQAPIFTATTTTTTTTLPPPPQQQSKTDLELAARVTSLEKKLSDLEQKNKTLDNTSQNLGSRVFNLKLRDLPHKIDKVVREFMREDVHVALQDPLQDRFRELAKVDMKEIFHQCMFETGTYKSLPEHYRKRRRDDQDPPPPPPDLDLSKKRRHDTCASGSSQPQAPQSSAWKKSDTRDALPGSSNQQSNPHAEQPVEDIPMPDNANISDSKDTDFAHLLKIKWERSSFTQANFKGQAYEVVKAFYPYVQFQMEECHKMLTDQIDWANPEGNQVRIDIKKPLPLSGPPVPLMVYLIGGLIVRNSTLTDTLLTQAARLPTRHRELPKQLHLTKLGWDAKGFEFKHDYTIIESPRAVVFLVGNNERKIIRFNEIYKFSDGTLTNIMEALEYRIKEYKVNRLNPEGSSETWNALLVVEYEILTTDSFEEPNEHIISTFRDNPLVSIEVLRYDIKKSKCENKGIVSTEMELELEQTQQGSSHEVSNIRAIPKYHSEDGNPARANIKQALGTSKTMNDQAFTIKKSMSMPVQLSQAQDSETPQVDDQRLDLVDDLKEAQVHISSSITSQEPKITTSMYKISHEESKTTS